MSVRGRKLAEANTEDAEVIDDTQTPGAGDRQEWDHPRAAGPHGEPASGDQTPAEGASPSASPSAAPSAGPNMTEEEYEAAEAARFDAERAGDEA